jgi:hypothetical protein
MSLLRNILGIWRPQAYHGLGKKKYFFEGWFFKLVDASRKNVLAVIPGISIGKDSHSFIQILDSVSHRSTYHKYPANDFQASSGYLDIKIASNTFKSDFLSLDIQSQERSLQGKVHFGQLKPWPVRLTSPGIMGWYAFVPFMECYHGVVSLDHQIRGSLVFDGRVISFDDGSGYIEKDWGKSFPEAYVWIQSNHFDQNGISLTASVAKIPWLTGAFRGFIIGLLLDDKLYRFTTYTGAKLNFLKIEDCCVHLEVEDRRNKLIIEAVRSEGGLLQAPYNMSMLNRISESLGSTVEVKFYRKSRGTESLIFSGSGDAAGLESNGKLDEIMDG